ncbi:unnamed protein product [Clonostachys rhizophaga]|uniref:Cytochrome P450 n=1 Tax=Clonostachys rhizophaga TaxID=160324 RepID=A0A9N9YNF3_9HYPO|nr:unnamed protein product [Clonostachys rhizophaga]
MANMFYLPIWLSAAVISASVYLAFLTVQYFLSTLRPKDFPPGPPTVLGLGNLHQIPLKKPYIKFQEWSRVYGEIISLKAGTANLIVLQSPEVLHELLSKRAAYYSGRPYSYISVERVFGEHRDKHILNVQNDSYLRRWRTAAAYLVGKNSSQDMMPMQEATSTTLARNLLKSTPSETLRELEKWALATPLLAVCGQRLEKRDPDFADRFFSIQKVWLELLEPGKAPPVDAFPFLRWVPERFALWKSNARMVRKFMLESYFSYLETALESGHDAKEKGGGSQRRFQSVLSRIMEDEEAEREKPNAKATFSHDELAYVGGGLIDAAVDTTWATLSSFVLYMVACPDAQAKAHGEISRVSPDQPPGGDVIEGIPYIRACLLEILRLCPAAPNGIPRVVSREDNYKGFRIPKGATVVANFWGMQRNPDDYDRPNEFLPERYLNHPLGLKARAQETAAKRATYTFGAGRRICPGDQFAQNSVLVAMSKLLWAYHIVPAEKEPLDLDVETAFHPGLILGPEPFKVDFVLRDAAREEAVLRDYDEAQAVLGGFGL